MTTKSNLFLAAASLAAAALGCTRVYYVREVAPAPAPSGRAPGFVPPAEYATSTPPEPLAEEMTQAPEDGWVWIEGFWHWNGTEWIWIPGHWEEPREEQVYVEPYYEVADAGYCTYVPGYWTDYADVPSSVIVIRDHRRRPPRVRIPPHGYRPDRDRRDDRRHVRDHRDRGPRDHRDPNPPTPPDSPRPGFDRGRRAPDSDRAEALPDPRRKPPIVERDPPLTNDDLPGIAIPRRPRHARGSRGETRPPRPIAPPARPGGYHSGRRPDRAASDAPERAAPPADRGFDPAPRPPRPSAPPERGRHGYTLTMPSSPPPHRSVAPSPRGPSRSDGGRGHSGRYERPSSPPPRADRPSPSPRPERHSPPPAARPERHAPAPARPDRQPPPARHSGGPASRAHRR